MNDEDPRREEPKAPTALERALRALSIIMVSLKQAEAPSLEPA